MKVVRDDTNQGIKPWPGDINSM